MSFIDFGGDGAKRGSQASAARVGDEPRKLVSPEVSCEIPQEVKSNFSRRFVNGYFLMSCRCILEPPKHFANLHLHGNFFMS